MRPLSRSASGGREPSPYVKQCLIGRFDSRSSSCDLCESIASPRYTIFLYSLTCELSQMVQRSQTDTSRESLEASITFMNGNSTEQENYTMLKVVPDSQKCLNKENRSLLAQISDVMNNSRVEVVVEKLLRENQKLQNELEEARAYVDQVDVEAEQQYSELSSEIAELCDLVEKKDHELITLKEKDELDSERDKSAHLVKEKETLQEELNSIRKAVEAEKGEALAKDVLLSIEIEDMQRELEKQKEILASTSIAQIVDRVR
ncbi:unnamed protein product [Angiostrongylus costaricensis]|uniref:HAP1 N-terminal domain-containing protein n=1 Tax=Angiostrongylus costaricensis TaxID=334426 RepID=A0A0R3PFZ0_ANGCS|nr:unnamed protein product [Angiostrongylus costaricensis]